MRKQHTSLHHRELTLLLVILITLFAISLFSTYHSSGAFLGFKIGSVDKEIDIATPLPAPLPEKNIDTTVKEPVTQKTLTHLGFASRFTPAGELSEISNSYGKIHFDQPISIASFSAAYFRDVALRLNYAFIDTSSPRFQLFITTPAEITLYNIPWFPGISSFVKYTNIGQSLPCPECALVTYDLTSVTFHVPGFSGYGINNPSPPSQSDVVLNATTSFITTHDDLMCNSLNAVDPDGDPLVMNYQFVVDGTNYTSVAMTFDINTSSLAADAVYDFSGNNHSGTLGNQFDIQAPLWVGMNDAKKGGAYQFDGIDDFILLQPRTFVSINQGMTVEAWIKLTNNYDYSVVFADGFYNTDGYSLGTNDGTDLAFFALKSNGILYMVTYPFAALPLHSYHHLVGVHDGTQQTLSLYIDGVLVNQSVGPGPAAGSDSTLERPSIGVDWLRDVLNRQQESYFEGTIDELLIFNRSLSSDEIYQHSQLRYHFIDEQETTLGETWSCIATPTDGYYVGYSNQSSSLTISSNQIPTHSSPYISTSSGQNVTSDSLFCLPQNVADTEGYPLRNVTRFIVHGNTSDVLFFPFDRSDFSHTEDFSGNGLNGTVSGAFFQETRGRVRGAYQFDGIDDFISVADSSLLDFD
ncbi:MAG: LamG domain-containing protein, partial [Nanoarchaeota archaeon]